MLAKGSIVHTTTTTNTAQHNINTGQHSIRTMLHITSHRIVLITWHLSVCMYNVRCGHLSSPIPYWET